MAEFDAEMLAEQAVLIGLLTREQVREAETRPRTAAIEALARVLIRKGMLTSWQLDKLLKGDVAGFFYGGCQVLFHIAEGTFARVYRGQRTNGGKPVAIKVLRKRFTTDPGRRPLQPGGRGRHEAGPPEHRPDLRVRRRGPQSLHDHGVRGRLQPPRLPEDPPPARSRGGLADDARPGPRAAVLARAGRDPPRHQGDEHPDRPQRRGQARRLRPGDRRRTTGSAETAHGQRTVDYSALERTCGSPKGDPRSDIYFLGCVFYQMLTGVLPLPEVEASDPLAKMLKRSFGAIKPLSEMRYAPDAELSRIIEKMMEMTWRSATQTMDEVVADLEAYERSRGSGKALSSQKTEAQIAEELFRHRL